MDEQNLGKGAIVDTFDGRDYRFSDIAGSILPFDWSKGYDIEEVIGKKLKVKDQNGSFSCGGQAWSYYGEVLDIDHEEKSAKFIYSQTFVGTGGSAGRTNCELVINKGWGDEALTSSYENGLPPSEIFMERIADINNKAFLDALIDKGLSYAHTDIDADSIAQSIRENKGCIIGIAGKNNGTWRIAFPLPPTSLEGSWNHWVYCGKAKMINGKKYIGFLNSWGESIGEKGWQWISVDYLQYPFVWSTWTMCYNFPKPVKDTPVFDRYPTLRAGCKGVAVKILQEILNRKTGCNLAVDGIFKDKTLKQVLWFQKVNKLKIDGVVGPATWLVLNK